ncbi:MAG: hypothetical protein ACI4AA_10740 [Lachnospiraceae bacterium]
MQLLLDPEHAADKIEIQGGKLMNIFVRILIGCFCLFGMSWGIKKRNEEIARMTADELERRQKMKDDK